MTITRRAQHWGRGLLSGPTAVAFASLIWRPAGPMQWLCEVLSRFYVRGPIGAAVAGLGRRWSGRGRPGL